MSHADRIAEKIADGVVGGADDVSLSWRRCSLVHRLDPRAGSRPERLTDSEFAERRRSAAGLLNVCPGTLDQLFGLVGAPGRCLLITDAEGVVLDQRIHASDEPMFRSANLWRKARWDEAAEGTNGIGTCLAERRRVTIERDQHFAARNTGLTCMDEPIFGPDGALMGALDLSCAREDATPTEQRLLTAVLAEGARKIEMGMFRSAFADCRIVVAGDDHRAGLVAIDADGLLRGATRRARHVLALDEAAFGRPFADGIEKPCASLPAAERRAIVGALGEAGGNATAAARALGVGRATLYRKMRTLGIDRPVGPSHS